jgi:hypothetical protein
LDQAEHHAEELRHLGEARNDAFWKHAGLSVSGHACCYLGKFLDARAYYENALLLWSPMYRAVSAAPEDGYVVIQSLLSRTQVRRSGPRGGNPNLFKGMGYSNNPGGRRKYDQGAKERMGEVTPEVVEFWIATMRDKSEEMSHRMRASENIAWGFLGHGCAALFT